jgi:hypothetical protein
MQVLVCNLLMASGKSVSTVDLRCRIRERSRSQRVHLHSAPTPEQQS